MSRLVFLDIAKAICIVLVVVGHYSPEGGSPAWWKDIHQLIYSFHMPMFLFASGVAYMLTNHRGYFDFVRKKVRRLVVPYFTVSILVISAKLLADGLLAVENPKNIDSFLRIFCYPEAGYYLWFVWVLFLSFLIVPFFTSRLSRTALLVVALFVYLGDFVLTDLFCIRQFGQFFVFFMLGVVAYDCKDQIKVLRNVNFMFYVLVFAVLYCFYGRIETLGGRVLMFAVNISGIAMVLSLSLYMRRRVSGKMVLWLCRQRPM